MNFISTLQTSLMSLPAPLKNATEWLLTRLPVERFIATLPAASAAMEREYAGVLDELTPGLKPYRGKVASYPRLPSQAIDRSEVLALMEKMAHEEAAAWQQGYASGAVYHGDSDHIAFLNKVYALYSQSNPLHSDLWPSINKFEAEIVAMTGAMLHGSQAASPKDHAVGCVTSGGTESILLAMKAYRDYARETKGIRHPELIVPVTAHAAFDKACQYFKIKKVSIPVTADFRASVPAARRALSRNTIALVASAPSFPHGIIDPIPELAALAVEHGTGLHTDACLGGFVLPWVPDSYGVTTFDFRVPGVTSISADTHKFGYASKGSSVILYRNAELRRYQYYATPDWPGGLYFSPTFAGSRPGAISAQCWAAMIAMGEDGYRQATARILATAAYVKDEIKRIDGLRILGDPLWVIAFAADGFDIYKVMDFMAKRKWSLNGLHRPSCVHICITLLHTQPGVAARFISDLQEAVSHVRTQPPSEGGMAPVYGLAASLPARGMVSGLLKRYLDRLYET